jgi:hypothetical protein
MRNRAPKPCIVHTAFGRVPLPGDSVRALHDFIMPASAHAADPLHPPCPPQRAAWMPQRLPGTSASESSLFPRMFVTRPVNCSEIYRDMFLSGLGACLSCPKDGKLTIACSYLVLRPLADARNRDRDHMVFKATAQHLMVLCCPLPRLRKQWRLSSVLFWRSRSRGSSLIPCSPS